MNNFTEPSGSDCFYQEKSGKRFSLKQHSVEVVNLWPNPAARQKTTRHPYWQNFKPVISIPHENIHQRIDELLGPFVMEGKQYLLPLETQSEKKRRPKEIQRLKWYSNIPEHIRSAVESFQDRQFHMLQFIWHCGPPALELVNSNPALSYILAGNRLFHRPKARNSLRSARLLLSPNKKQKDILEWLGFPPTNKVRNLLRRIIYEAINIPSLLRLRQNISIRPEVLKILSHRYRINAGVLRIVNDPELLRCVSGKFLDEISRSVADDTCHQTAYSLKKILNTFRLVNLKKNKYPVIDSFQKLLEIQKDMDEKIFKFMNPKTDLIFPVPPIEGTDTIIPLINAHEVISEGYHQRNCAASHIKHVTIRKNCYIYRVISPERSTLSLKKNEDESWKIDELEIAGNHPVSEYTEKVINLWIATHQI